MKTKQCKHCGQDFSSKRNDAKFCSSACRSLYWYSNHSQMDAGDDFRNQLKGVRDDNPAPVKKIIIEKSPNKEFVALESKLKAMENEFTRLKQLQQKLLQQLQSLQYSSNGGITLLGTGTGAAIGYNNSKNFKNDPNKRFSEALKGGLWGLFGGVALELLTKDIREEKRLEDVTKLNVAIKDVNAKLTLMDNDMDELRSLIANTEPELLVEKEVIEAPEGKINCDIEKTSEVKDNKQVLHVNKHLETTVKTINNDLLNSKIISSNQLTEMNYRALNFQGSWQILFGLPSVNFHCAVHGMSGEGKSTFAIQFASYLSEYFGKVIYISGEEGFSKTMKDKFVNNNAASENLFIADLRTYQDIVTEVKPDNYHFIFVDSLDNMRIGANEMKSLRKLYQNSAIITISQSTKEGKMRGSYEIVHDSDIAVSVSNGIAVTTKNRFLEKGRTYKIFGTVPEREIKPWNTIMG